MAIRLSDSQNRELVGSYRRGESTRCLTERFGCSPDTIDKIAKTVLGPDDYQALRQTRSTAMNVKLEKEKVKRINLKTEETNTSMENAREIQAENNKRRQNIRRSLAIEDADDFIDDNDVICEDIENDDFNNRKVNFTDGYNMLIAQYFVYETEDIYSFIPQPLVAASLPNNLYLLVDKNMELQSKLLKEFSRFSNLPGEEGDRQALIVFGDLRQAKKLCGRTQRIIKLPDPYLLQRTASYLLARGITRVLLDGNLYSLDL